MRNIINVFLLIFFLGISKEGSSQFSLEYILGTRITTDRIVGPNRYGPAKVLTALQTGVSLNYKKLNNLNLSYQRSFVQNFTNFGGNTLNTIGAIGVVANIWEEDQILVYHDLNRFRFGLGHYWRKRENNGNFLFQGSQTTNRKGIIILFSLPTKWIDVEFRSKVNYSPDFGALLGTESYGLVLTHRLSKIHKRYSSLDFLTVNGIIGARFFPINIELLPGESFIKPFGIAPGLGVEILFNDLNISFNLEKDWWNSFNAGSNIRTVKGLIYSSFIGVKYHQKLKNDRTIRFGIGGSWIEDDENKLDLITLNPTAEQQKLVNYQVKGIGISISYEFIQNVDIELKTTLPTIGESIFENSSRTSLGLFYRFNPLR